VPRCGQINAFEARRDAFAFDYFEALKLEATIGHRATQH
jgi:hypothetical protein